MPPNKSPSVIGITGITGSGTSTAAKILAEEGGFVISADKLSHELMKMGAGAYNEIVKSFGEGILCEDGEIDRRALGGIVFGDREKMTLLEGIIHPEVIARTQEMIEDSIGMGYKFAVIDAPLLIESGMDKICTSCWLITAPDSARLERIQSRDGITPEMASRRLKSRQGDSFLRPHAHIVIENSSDIESLRTKVLEALKQTPRKEFT